MKTELLALAKEMENPVNHDASWRRAWAKQLRALAATQSGEVTDAGPELSTPQEVEDCLATLDGPLDPPRGDVVIICNEARTVCHAVTRQDKEGHILSVIWEAPDPSADALKQFIASQEPLGRDAEKILAEHPEEFLDMPTDAPMKAEPVRVTHAVVARLIKLLPGLEYARETHVHWANCSSEARDRNPDIGDKAFHDACVREYDECIAAITDAIAALKATLQS